MRVLNRVSFEKNGLPVGGVIKNRAESLAPSSAPEPVDSALATARSAAQAEHARSVVSRVVLPGAVGFGLGASSNNCRDHHDGDDSERTVPDVASFKESVMEAKAESLAAQHEQAAASHPVMPDADPVVFDVGIDG